MKKIYIYPTIEMLEIAVEQGFAASGATPIPPTGGESGVDDLSEDPAI
ncbi:MAG: hypothetical protein RR908_06060 [Rikenellaceae bacterium]